MATVYNPFFNIPPSRSKTKTKTKKQKNKKNKQEKKEKTKTSTTNNKKKNRFHHTNKKIIKFPSTKHTTFFAKKDRLVDWLIMTKTNTTESTYHDFHYHHHNPKVAPVLPNPLQSNLFLHFRYTLSFQHFQPLFYSLL